MVPLPCYACFLARDLPIPYLPAMPQSRYPVVTFPPKMECHHMGIRVKVNSANKGICVKVNSPNAGKLVKVNSTNLGMCVKVNMGIHLNVNSPNMGTIQVD